PREPGGAPEPRRQDYLLVRTTGVSGVFPGPGESRRVPSKFPLASELRPGDLVVVESGQVVPRDGEVVEGAASVDESMLNGVSTSVLCEAGGSRSRVLGWASRPRRARHVAGPRRAAHR